MKERGSAFGYRSIAKQSCRKWIWDLICDDEIGDVAMMPSIDGREIFEALERGYQPFQLHVIDRNPAVVATLQRIYPGIKTYGVEVERAFERMTRNGVRLFAAHVDYCSNVSAKMWGSLRRLAIEPCQWDCMLFVTVLRGRESWTNNIRRFMAQKGPAGMFRDLKTRSDMWHSTEIAPTEFDVLRLSMLSMATRRFIDQVHPYKSTNGQTFMTVRFCPLKLDHVNTIMKISGEAAQWQRHVRKNG